VCSHQHIQTCPGRTSLAVIFATSKGCFVLVHMLARAHTHTHTRRETYYPTHKYHLTCQKRLPRSADVIKTAHTGQTRSPLLAPVQASICLNGLSTTFINCFRRAISKQMGCWMAGMHPGLLVLTFQVMPLSEKTPNTGWMARRCTISFLIQNRKKCSRHLHRKVLACRFCRSFRLHDSPVDIAKEYGYIPDEYGYIYRAIM